MILAIVCWLTILSITNGEFVPSILIGRGAQDSSLQRVDNTNKLASTCSGTTELHVVSFNNGFGASISIDVDRKTPVVLFLNFNTALRVLEIKKSAQTTIAQVILMSTAVISKEAVIGVTSDKILLLSEYPYTPYQGGFVVGEATTTTLIDYAQQFTQLQTTSFHGVSELSTLQISPATTGKQCESCGTNEIYNGIEGKCVCAFGYKGTAGSCVEQTFTLTPTVYRVSNAARIDFRVKTSENVPFGNDMKCKIGTFTFSAYWRGKNELACQVQPQVGSSLAPGDYDLLFMAKSTSGLSKTASKVTVFDGITHCSAATSCATCDKTACVYCADGARACVPGSERFGPSLACDNWHSKTCPNFVLQIEGPSQRAVIQTGVTHAYSFVIAPGAVENVRVLVTSFPRQVQQNTNLGIYLQKNSPANPNDPVNGYLYKYEYDSTKNPPKGDFETAHCDLTSGTWHIALVSSVPTYQYDIALKYACDCPNDPNASAAPTVTGLDTYASSLLDVDGTVRSISVSGSGFNDAFGRLSCRFEGDNGQYWYAQGLLSAGTVQCVVPSFDEAPDATVRNKAPNRAKVSVSNDRCNWSTDALYYSQYLDLTMNTFGGRGLMSPDVVDTAEVGPLAREKYDLFRVDLRDFGTSAATFLARLLIEGGPLELYVFPASSIPSLADGKLECDVGGVRCGVRGEGSLNVQWSLSDCNLDGQVWYMAILNKGGASVAYTAGVQCGCGDVVGTISSLEPPFGAVDGYDFVTVKGSGFRRSTVAQCDFGSAGTTPANYINPTEVQCLTPPQLTENRPSSVSLAIVGENEVARARPCSTSSQSVFNYFVQLNIGQEYSMKLLNDQPALFVFDFSQNANAVNRKRADEAVSFQVEVEPSSPLDKLSLEVMPNELPTKPTTEPALSPTGVYKSKLYCQQPFDRRWFISLWSGGGDINVKITIKDPPECVGMTAAPEPPTNNNGPSSNQTPAATTDGNALFVHSIVFGVVGAIALF